MREGGKDVGHATDAACKLSTHQSPFRIKLKYLLNSHTAKRLVSSAPAASGGSGAQQAPGLPGLWHKQAERAGSEAASSASGGREVEGSTQ